MTVAVLIECICINIIVHATVFLYSLFDGNRTHTTVPIVELISAQSPEFREGCIY